jgi:hypothetical protein
LTFCDTFFSSSEDSSSKGCHLCLPAASIAMCVGLLAVREEKEEFNDNDGMCALVTNSFIMQSKSIAYAILHLLGAPAQKDWMGHNGTISRI